MRQLMKISVTKLKRDEQQPRKHFDEAVIAGLAASMKNIGQQVPVIVYDSTLLDGECRWRAAQLADIAELDCIVLDKRPTATELIITQLSLDVCRASLKPTERANALQRILEEKNWTLTEACKSMGISQSLGSKLAALAKLPGELRLKLDGGELDLEKAYIITQEPNLERQLELAKQAASMTRDIFRKRAHAFATGAEPKASSARFAMPGGYFVSLQGADLTLTSATEILSETVRLLKKGLAQGLDITTQQRVMKDTVRSASKSTHSTERTGG